MSEGLKLNELNRLLSVVETLSIGTSGALQKDVIDNCRDIVMKGQFPNHTLTLNSANLLGLTKSKVNRIKLTKFGIEFLKLNPEKKYDLTEEQKDFLVRTCLLKGNVSIEVARLLAKFSKNVALRTYQYSLIEDTPIFENNSILPIMIQTGLLKNLDGLLSVHERHVNLVRELIRPSSVLSPEQFYKIRKHSEEIGKIAEEIVFEFEKNRLIVNMCKNEADCVQWTSSVDVAAGYDIASYDGKTLDLIPDRFIEVKGSTSSDLSFYWSSGEVEQAQKIGNNYWLYFVGDIDVVKRKSKSRIQLFRDPYSSIIKSGAYNVVVTDYHVSRL